MTVTAPTPTSTATTSSSADRVFGILALVFGIASIALGSQPVFAIAGLVLGIMSLRRESSARGFAIGGIVTSAVTLGGMVIAAIVAVVLLPLIAIASLAS